MFCVSHSRVTKAAVVPVQGEIDGLGKRAMGRQGNWRLSCFFFSFSFLKVKIFGQEKGKEAKKQTAAWKQEKSWEDNGDHQLYHAQPHADGLKLE